MKTCEEDVQKVILKVLETYNLTVTCGHRSLEEQTRLYHAKKTKVLKGKHNDYPSRAVDVVPIIQGAPEWDNREELAYMSGLVMGVAYALGVKLRWGGDWDRDNITTEREPGKDSWDDMFHFELV